MISLHKIQNYKNNIKVHILRLHPVRRYVATPKGTDPFRATTQPAITCSKLTTETLEQGVKYG